ncbi:tape measure protein [Flavobacterium soyangense]|uniref:Tape measure protein n=1 Tax=Flavobacterium soyangense TaxID=2023265 RepID=A0A930UDA0_9FLAO|nr:tape measure protein [Flavobacterium soyangense]MBF2709955.1 tape measure protein [Flavobacterium soyangense]
MSEGTITRKDIITDEALNWGNEYKQTLEAAIGKNKEFVAGILEIHEANKLLRGSIDQKQFTENSKKINEESQKTIAIWKEQIQLENALIATKKKNELATEGTNRALVKERLELALTNKQIKQEALERLGLVGAYEKLNKSRTDAKNKLRDLIVSEKASTLEITKAQKAFDGYDAKIKKADKAVGDFSKNVGNYKSAFSGIGNLFSAFGIVGGIAGLVAITKSSYDTTKELQSLNLALKSVTETQENFKEQQTFLSAISSKYGLEIKNLTKQYVSFYVAAKNKLAGKEIQDLFENIAKSGSALGLSNETLERSFVALNQMLSKGTVASEELRGQLSEALPGSVQAMVKAVQKLHPEIKNLTEKGLFEMIKAGKVLASEVLPETARQLVILTGADKAEGIETLTKLSNRLSNSWTKLISSINDTDTSGFGIFVKKIVSGLTTILDFTGLLFKNESQLSDYFQNIGKSKGLEEYQKIMNNISTTSKENQEATKKELLFRERETIRVNQAIIKAEKAKRDSIAGGDRALFHLQTKQEEDALVAIGKSSAIIKKINEDALNSNVKSTKAPVPEETAKEKAAREKALRDRLDSEKKLSDSLYEVDKQRLERSIKINDEVSKDDLETDDVRIAAALNSQNKQIELIELTKKHSLDADKFVLDKDKLNANQKLLITRDAAFKIEDIKKETSKEIDKINEFDAKSYEDSIKRGVTEIEISNNNKLAAEEKRFQDELALGYENDKAKEKAAENHEKALFNIKKEGIIATTSLQIKALNNEIDAYEKQSDGSQKSQDFILEKRRQVSELTVKLTQAEGDKFKENEDYKGKSGAERLGLWYAANKKTIDEITQISTETLGALTDLGNAFTAREIQNLDDKISKNNEYYDKQIELAGTDERQKDLLQKERDKKNEELEKKKRKAQEKQAKYDKAAAIAQAGISTALAVLAALSTQPFLPLGPIMATLAGVLGAIQIATIIATPIPKYKMGRKGGPAEFAIVGDGGVSEVIERKSGKIELTPKVPTLTHLGQGDIVHSSIDSYDKSMRASILASLGVDSRKMSEFQATQIFENDNKELVKEMQLTRKAIEKNKTNVTVNVPKIDIPHEIWKMKNTNWNQ